MKKTLQFVNRMGLSILMMFIGLQVAAQATTTVTIDGAIYELDLINGTAILTDGKATTGDFVVPNVITEDGIDCTVIGIGNGAFDENTNLTSITLNEDLKTIGDDAFQYSSIPSLHLGPNVQSVGHDFHYKATSLAEITVDENNPYLCAENSLLMSKDKKIVWGFPVANPATELILPEEVEIVKDDAINRCKNLLTIVINDNCKIIESYAFDNCTACTSLTMGKNITFVGHMAFRSFKALTELTLPDELLEIDDYGFSFNTNVKSLVVPNKVERIGHGAFNHFDACERFELPASLTNYGPTPFSYCNSLQEMVNHAVEPPLLSDELFNDESLYSTVLLLVPAGSKEAYDNANIWQKFANIEEMPVSSVDGVKTIDNASVVGIYTLDGKRVNELQPGVNIVRMSDGTSRKVIK